MKNRLLIILAPLYFTPCFLQAQTEKDSVQITFKPYVSLRGHIAVFDKEMEVQENITRVGATFSAKKGIISFIAASELHLNLFKGGGTFNVDGNNENQFLNVQTINNTQTFTNRLGYIGVSFEKYGTLTIGKQWSVYYDVTSYTDNFYVFGGTASATYIGGTDGGESGTGRASQSVIYRNSIGKFDFGAQIQARAGNNNHFVDGYGFSAQYHINQQFALGTAYNKAYINKKYITDHKIIGLDNEPTYYAVGAKYKGERLSINIVGAIEKSGDIRQGRYYDNVNQLIIPSVVFNAKGFEVYSKYNFNKFSIHGGYNYYKPDIKAIPLENNQAPLNPSFKVNNLLFGFTYQPLPFIKIYNEQRIAFGSNNLGIKDKSVFTLGMILDFSKKFNKKFNIKNIM